jgi:hypothetical protein
MSILKELNTAWIRTKKTIIGNVSISEELEVRMRQRAKEHG